MAMSHAEAGKLGQIKSIPTQRKQFEDRVATYLQNPVRCRECDAPIPYYERKKKQFCNRSCAATFNNRTGVAPKRSKGSCVSCRKPLVSKKPTMSCSLICDQKQKRRIRVESGTASAKVVKTYLLDIHGERCLNPNCAWDFDKVPIKVELEHIDGNSENNTLANTTLLCANCHGLTPTYKNKNKGNGRAYRRQRYADGKSY